MEALSKQIVALKRKLLVRFSRSNATTVVGLSAIASVLSLLTLVWAITSITIIREERKQQSYQSLRLVQSQIDATLQSELNLLGMASIRASGLLPSIQSKNIKGDGLSNYQLWRPSSKNFSIEMIDKKEEGTKQGAKVSSIEDPAFQQFIQKNWQRFVDQKGIDGSPRSILGQANIAMTSNESSLAFVVPIVSTKGKVIGAISTKIPVSRIRRLLPENTYFCESATTTQVGKEGTVPETPQTRQSAESIATRIHVSDSVPSWRIRADHYSDELWASSEVKVVFDFTFFLLATIWIANYAFIKTGNKTRNRQRMLIGSLVRKLIWITNEKGQVSHVLGKIGDHLGWKEIDYLDVEIGLFVHPDDRQLITEALVNAHTAVSRDEILEIRFENKDREYRWYEVTITNMMDVPEIYGIVVTAHDIEQRMHATAHILASKRAAEKANEAKSEFLSRMSHELRTPLNAILGFGQLLEMEAISDRQAENVDQILIAGRHLLDLVNDILDIARIETRNVNLSLERVNIKDVLDESVALLSPLAKRSNVTLAIEKFECPDTQSDRQRLKQIFLNLLSNGIKYNRPGGSVCVSVTHDESGLSIVFADTGIGIESHYLDRVFTPFDRLGSDTTNVEGTGLGLALSKTLVEAMGARLEVSSVFGIGSTFTLSFPPSCIARPALQEEETYTDPIEKNSFENPNNLRVLLIEDNIVNLRYISKFVEKLDGVALMSAKEGGIGIELAHQHRPDLILLDLDLPDINGHEVLKSLREDPLIRDTHIIVMSAETNPHIIEQTLALGAYRFVTKPVDVRSLFTLFDEEKKAA